MKLILENWRKYVNESDSSGRAEKLAKYILGSAPDWGKENGWAANQLLFSLEEPSEEDAKAGIVSPFVKEIFDAYTQLLFEELKPVAQLKAEYDAWIHSRPFPKGPMALGWDRDPDPTAAWYTARRGINKILTGMSSFMGREGISLFRHMYVVITEELAMADRWEDVEELRKLRNQFEAQWRFHLEIYYYRKYKK